jgi:hypothetical protein
MSTRLAIDFGGAGDAVVIIIIVGGSTMTRCRWGM